MAKPYKKKLFQQRPQCCSVNVSVLAERAVTFSRGRRIHIVLQLKPDRISIFCITTPRKSDLTFNFNSSTYTKNSLHDLKSKRLSQLKTPTCRKDKREHSRYWLLSSSFSFSQVSFSLSKIRYLKLTNNVRIISYRNLQIPNRKPECK